MHSKADGSPKFVQRALDQLNALKPRKISIFTPDPEIEINGKIYYFASLNKRLLASTLDVMLITILLMPLNLLFNYFNEEIFKVQIRPEYVLEQPSVSTIIKILSESGILSKMILVQLGILFFIGIYMVSFWCSKKMGTPGKMLFRCVTLDIRTGSRISLRQAIIRFISMPLSVIPLLIGLFMIDWTKNRQALHDKIAKTIVVYSKK